MTDSSSPTPTDSTSHPIEGPAAPVLPRPAWAEVSQINHGVVTAGDTAVHHTWRSPTRSAVWSGGEVGQAYAEVVQTDLLEVTEGGTVASTKSLVIYLGWLDAEISSTAEARKLAEAIVACCDRLDGAK